MTEYTKVQLLALKKRVLSEVEEGKLGVVAAARMLGITRQGLWKLRLRYRSHHNLALVGRKRGPKSYHRVHNRTPDNIEEMVSQAFINHSVGPDTLKWIMETPEEGYVGWIPISRSTIYRILVRRRLITPKGKPINVHRKRYTKGYPGEEVQIDTTEPFGKGRGILLDIVDDYSRYSGSYFYEHNTSSEAARCFKDFLDHAPFPVLAARTDNGSEFKKDFTSICKSRDILIRRNPPHTPQHNGKVERFHKTVDEECLWRIPKNQDNPMETIQYHLNRYSSWYNTKRVHGGYHMHCTPQHKIEDWILANKTGELYQRDVNETLILYTDEEES